MRRLTVSFKELLYCPTHYSSYMEYMVEVAQAQLISFLMYGGITVFEFTIFISDLYYIINKYSLFSFLSLFSLSLSLILSLGVMILRSSCMMMSLVLLLHHQ